MDVKSVSMASTKNHSRGKKSRGQNRGQNFHQLKLSEISKSHHHQKFPDQNQHTRTKKPSFDISAKLKTQCKNISAQYGYTIDCKKAEILSDYFTDNDVAYVEIYSFFNIPRFLLEYYQDFRMLLHVCNIQITNSFSAHMIRSREK